MCACSMFSKHVRSSSGGPAMCAAAAGQHVRQLAPHCFVRRPSLAAVASIDATCESTAECCAVSFAAQACVAGVVCMHAATHGVSHVGAQVASQVAPRVALFVRVVGWGNACLDLVQINQGFHNKSNALGPKAAHSPPESLFDCLAHEHHDEAITMLCI